MGAIGAAGFGFFRRRAITFTRDGAHRFLRLADYFSLEFLCRARQVEF